MSCQSDKYRDIVNISQPGILDSFHLSFLGRPPHRNSVEDKGKGVDYDSGTTSVTEPTDAPAGAKLDVLSKEDPSKPSYKSPRYCISKIQALEKIFQNCPLPTVTQRKELSHDIGLEEDKIKYWFQNRRNQEKRKRERLENQFLRKEIDKVRAENEQLKKALYKIANRPNSGQGSLGSSFDHNLKLELGTLLPSGSISPSEGLPAGEAGGIHDAGLDGSLQLDEFLMPVPAEHISLSSKNPFDEELCW